MVVPHSGCDGGMSCGRRGGGMISAAVGQRVLGLLYVVVILACFPRPVTAATLSMSVGSPLVSYSEQAEGTQIDPGLTITSDTDELSLVSASAKLTTTDVNDIMEFGPNLTAPFFPAVRGPYDSSTGVINITGEVGFRAYNLWLQNIRFKNMNDRPVPGDRTVEFKVGTWII